MYMGDVHTIMQQVSEASISVPLVAALVGARHLDASSKLVLIILLFAAVPQFTTSSVSSYSKSLFYNLYTIVDLLFWGVVFLLNIPQRGPRLIILLSMIAFLIISLILFSHQPIGDRFVSELVCFDSLLQVFFVMMYFLNLYQEDNRLELEHIPFFWFALGLLVYAPVTYFHFAFYGQVAKELHIIHNVVNTLMYLLFAIGMMQNLPNLKRYSR